MPAYISSLRIIKFTCAKLRISSSQLSWTYCLFLLLSGKYYFVSLKTLCILLHYRKFQIKIMISIIRDSELMSCDLRGKMFWTAFLTAFSFDIAALYDILEYVGFMSFSFYNRTVFIYESW
jgi:hypothetical protein